VVIQGLGCQLEFKTKATELLPWGQRGEMTQALYAHMSSKTIKIKKKKKRTSTNDKHSD
jgi:hypothetical protein